MIKYLSRYGAARQSVLRFEASVHTVAFIVSVYLVIFDNFAFWRAVRAALG